MSAHICVRYRDNLFAAAVFCFCLYTGAAIAQEVGVPPRFSGEQVNNLTVPFFGVPLTVLAMAACGAFIGAGYTPPVESRKKLFTLTFANTMFAAWFVVLIPEWRGWSVSPVAMPPLAGVIAAANCVVVPAIFKRLPDAASAWVDALSSALGRFFNRTPKE